MVASYIGVTHHRQEVRTFGGKDPIEFYLDDVMLHGTAESVADQIRALEAERHDLPDGRTHEPPLLHAAHRQGAAAHCRMSRRAP